MKGQNDGGTAFNKGMRQAHRTAAPAPLKRESQDSKSLGGQHEEI